MLGSVKFHLNFIKGKGRRTEDIYTIRKTKINKLQCSYLQYDPMFHLKLSDNSSERIIFLPKYC